ncbi:microcompartments protein [Melioribacter roseus P3M-2]|uniref:Microcompartments protein n=1 Tax=Melioribacter roseus (strain DSM 23840 / JCM 17771 / VKM B-2668 / P3M-2) TaxID=1191523 RepID=I7A040_MELRP|nr:BMC domain-containing protein [Melioribacter roseus]AFN73346.1 microcompartments protein [Melioribacter roseus P3M-2]
MAKGVALGFIETRGNTGAVNAIDAMLKTANVEFVKRVEIGGGYVTALVRGEVGAVRSSVEAGAEAAARVGELVCTNIIPSAHEEVFELLMLNK